MSTTQLSPRQARDLETKVKTQAAQIRHLKAQLAEATELSMNLIIGATPTLAEIEKMANA